ncbi:MAG: diguanylate cyclase [Candidatus Hydrogenedentes bacterium]|nr:diguanylate cyclase [Candidatus Hydrogenedentota bacterium]
MCNRTDNQDYSLRKVLIADDEPAVARTLETLIKMLFKSQALSVYNGNAVLDACAREAPDVLIVDMVMPGLSGLDLVSAVHEHWPYVDIIVVTGQFEDFPYVKVIRTGAKDFLAKPYQHGELEAKLLRIFRERDLRDAEIVAESKYRSLFEKNTDGMAILNESSRVVTSVNAAFCRIMGAPEEVFIGRSILEFVDPSEQERFDAGLTLCSRNGQGTLSDIMLLRKDGDKVYMDMSLTFINVMRERIVCLTFKDTTERRDLEQRLVEVAQVDSLTGLFNRRAFNTELDVAITHARSGVSALTLISIDVDNFKKCNDSEGHQAGDCVLKTLGRLIRKSIRANIDSGFRCGGDEFAIIVDGAKAEVAVHIAERLRNEYQEDETYGTSLSIGIAEYCHGMSGKEFVRSADDAMYRAKALGKNNLFVAQRCDKPESPCEKSSQP